MEEPRHITEDLSQRISAFAFQPSIVRNGRPRCVVGSDLNIEGDIQLATAEKFPEAPASDTNENSVLIAALHFAQSIKATASSLELEMAVHRCIETVVSAINDDSNTRKRTRALNATNALLDLPYFCGARNDNDRSHHA